MPAKLKVNIPDDTNHYVELRYHQLFALFYKNFLLVTHYWPTTLLQIVVPFSMIIVLVAYQDVMNRIDYDALELKNPVDYDFPPISRCTEGYDFSGCYTIAYVRPPAYAEQADALIALVLSQNKNTIPQSEVIAFETYLDLDDYVYYNPNRTQGAYVFDPLVDYSQPYIKYTVQFNQTSVCTATMLCSNPESEYFIPYKVAMDRAILTYQYENSSPYLPSVGSSSLPPVFDVSYSQTPHPELPSYNVAVAWAGTLFYSAMIFSLVIQAEQVVSEKEQKLRAGMQVMGLKNSIYYLSWFVTHLIINQMGVCLACAAGWLIQMRLFYINSILIVYLVLSGFGITMIALSYVIAACCNQAKYASYIGFALFLVGFVAYPLSTSVVYTDSVSEDWIRYLAAFLSPFVFSKSIFDLAILAGPGLDGVRWYDIYNTSSIWPIYRTLIFYFIDTILYLLIAWYLDSVLPVEYGVSQPWYFFLTPTYWLDRSLWQRKKDRIEINEKEEEDLKHVMDDDVWAERQRVIREERPEEVAIQIVKLKKVYKKFFFPSKFDFTAVKGLCLNVEKDSLFCLLGHNGAGKTTTFNMLVGMFAPSSGDTIIYGRSIRKNIAEIRNQLGFCPQHDLLWMPFTARQHLRIYAAFKNIPANKVAAEIDARLEDVGLQDHGRIPVSAFSAGLRRRLSIAISLIGNPKVVYMDEPTTGMGPIAMRQVWQVIEANKKGRVIILTTHAMEEAEMLADKIGIMSKGQFAALGTSEHLRAKFGVGYQLRMSGPADQVEELKDVVTRVIPDAKFMPTTKTVQGFVDFAIMRATGHPDISKLLVTLDSKKKDGSLYEYSIGLSSLEDVFIHIAEKAKAEGFDANDADAEKKLKRKQSQDIDINVLEVEDKADGGDELEGVIVREGSDEEN